MDLKNQLEQGREAGKRQYMVRRLAKAVAHAGELVRLVSARCDARSVLEAEVYLCWMAGSWGLEKEADWGGALGRFLRAKCVG